MNEQFQGVPEEGHTISVFFPGVLYLEIIFEREVVFDELHDEFI
jgi:hypothetical protein